MIGAGENAILARLKAASDAGVLGYRYATIESYPADWDDYFKDKAPRAPGVWAVFAGIKGCESTGIGMMRGRGMFGVVVMAENARNETAQRHGGATPAEVGSYQMVDDVIGLLQGQDLDVFGTAIEVRAVHFVRTQQIVRERKVSMLAVEIEADVTYSSMPIGGNPIGDFKTFHVDWDVPPASAIDADPATPGIQLPDDAHADAVDNLTLETDS